MWLRDWTASLANLREWRIPVSLNLFPHLNTYTSQKPFHPLSFLTSVEPNQVPSLPRFSGEFPLSPTPAALRHRKTAAGLLLHISFLRHSPSFFPFLSHRQICKPIATVSFNHLPPAAAATAELTDGRLLSSHLLLFLLRSKAPKYPSPFFQSQPPTTVPPSATTKSLDLRHRTCKPQAATPHLHLLHSASSSSLSLHHNPVIHPRYLRYPTTGADLAFLRLISPPPPSTAVGSLPPLPISPATSKPSPSLHLLPHPNPKTLIFQIFKFLQNHTPFHEIDLGEHLQTPPSTRSTT